MSDFIQDLMDTITLTGQNLMRATQGHITILQAEQLNITAKHITIRTVSVFCFLFIFSSSYIIDSTYFLAIVHTDDTVYISSRRDSVSTNVSQM